MMCSATSSPNSTARAPALFGASDSPSSSRPEAHLREYIWLPEAEIAPTRGSRTNVDRPLAVVSGVNTGSPALLMVHVDQINRPVKMTSSAGAVVWAAVYNPFGSAFSITGAETNNERFPGQWFQLEAGLHYNWHRHYDPTLGRYTQPDPLGFVDGPSVYAYAGSRPTELTDKAGLASPGPRPTYTPRPPEPQDQVCTTGWFANRMNSNPAVLACCKIHDDCYAQNKCTSESWTAPTSNNWPGSKPFCPPACAKCNDEVVKCVRKAYTGW